MEKMKKQANNPRCLAHCSVDDAFYITSCIASFLQLASRGIVERVAKDGKPGILEDALYGMETCFDLLQDMIEVAEKESASKGAGND